MISSSYRIIFVIPVFEDKISCLQILKDIFDQFGKQVFVVLVDDGSVINPMRAEDISGAGGDGIVISLVRNVGHQTAIAAGLSYVATRMSDSQKVVIMDSDGEDLPETIPILMDKLVENVDAVVAVRGSRKVSLNFKIFYGFYKLIFKLMTGRKISFGNFMVLTRSAVQRLVSMRELGVHLAGSLISSRLRVEKCRIDRGQRYFGKSKMNFFSLALHGFKALMIFAEDVLVRTGVFCAVLSVVSVAGIICAIVLKAVGFATPGWFSVALGILVLILLQTGVLALITLLMTGLLRSNTVTGPGYYADLIRTESPTAI